MKNGLAKRTPAIVCSPVLWLIVLSCLVGWNLAVGSENQSNEPDGGRKTLAVTNDNDLSAESTGGDTGKVFKVLSLQKSDRVLVVDSNRRMVSLREKAGNEVWSVDVTEKLKGHIAPGDKIRDVRIDDNRLLITVGKHSFATVELESGKVSFLGSD